MVSTPLNTLIQAVISVALIMWSATVHEVAHGYVAYRCGDPTAKAQGRLTLNPLAHIDPFGSIILPLILALLGGPIFGYAKPVPYNPNNLRHRRRDELLVGLAGPASNVVQALIGAAILALLVAVAPQVLFGVPLVADVVTDYIVINLVLCFFNLIPLPPLDGSSIIGYFVPDRYLGRYYDIQRYAMPILLIVLYVLPEFFHVNPLGWYFTHTAYPLYDMLVRGAMGVL